MFLDGMFTETYSVTDINDEMCITPIGHNCIGIMKIRETNLINLRADVTPSDDAAGLAADARGP